MSLRSRFTVFAEASAAGFADFKAIYPRHSWLLGGTLRSASQVVFFGLVGTLLGSREHERFLVIGNAVMATALQSSMVVANIALERRAGTFPLIVSSPANPAVVLLGRNVAWPLTGVAVGLASLLLVGPFFGVTLTPGRVLLLVPLVALVALSTFCFSFVLASVALRSVAIRDVLSALTGLGLMTLCGVQVPVAFWPSPVRVVSNVLPLTHGLGAIRAALAGQPAGPVIRGALLECLVAATWSIIGALAVRRLIEASRRDGTLELGE